jgi:predicted nuclease with TOPRIM domain
MGLGADFLSILKDTVRLTDSVERLNASNSQLQDKVDKINERVIRLEARLDTYVEIAKQNQKMLK